MKIELEKKKDGRIFILLFFLELLTSLDVDVGTSGSIIKQSLCELSASSSICLLDMNSKFSLFFFLS